MNSHPFPFGMPAIVYPEHGAWHFLTLTQPWATLMALDAKRVETRSWKTKWRGWFGIHASKTFPPECRALCLQQPFLQVIAAAGYRSVGDLPLGQLLAVTELVDCVKTESIRGRLSVAERAFGNYDDGRQAWITRGVRRLREPFLMQGAQGLRRLPRAVKLEELV